MQRFVIRIAIALIAFASGVITATVYNGVFGGAAPKSRFESTSPKIEKRKPCPHSTRVISELMPLPPVAPLAPLPPLPSVEESNFGKRITLKLPDGTIKVVESRSETKVAVR